MAMEGLVKPKVKLTGEDGNAFYIIAKVSAALRKAGYEKEAREFREKAVQDDYNHVLATVDEYVEVE